MFIEFHIALLESSAWSNMLRLNPEKVFWIEKIVRPIIVYSFLVIIFRVLGNRELAQLNPMDLIVLLLLSNTVQNAIIGGDTSFKRRISRSVGVAWDQLHSGFFENSGFFEIQKHEI